MIIPIGIITELNFHLTNIIGFSPRMFAPKCAACGKGITPVEVLFFSLFIYK